MPDLKYLPGIIPMIFGEYVLCVIGSVFHKYYCCCCCRGKYSCNDSELSEDSTPDLRIFKFEDTYESRSTVFKYILFATRLLSFGYIFGISTVANYIRTNGTFWYFFTLWNMQLLSVYYFFTLVCSIIGVFKKPKIKSPVGRYYVEDYSGNLKESADQNNSAPLEWSIHTVRFGNIVHALFAICSGVNALITFIIFAFLDRSLTFWNVSTHLVPLITLLLELALNNMYIQVNQFAYCATWIWLYMIVIWPLVALGALRTWPYEFLAVDKPICFFTYTALIVLAVIFYFIMYGLSYWKYTCRRVKGDSTEGTTNNIFNFFVGSSV